MDLTLQQLVDIGRAMETSERQIKSIEGATSRLSINNDNPTVAAVHRTDNRRRQHSSTSRHPTATSPDRSVDIVERISHILADEQAARLMVVDVMHVTSSTTTQRCARVQTKTTPISRRRRDSQPINRHIDRNHLEADTRCTW